MSKEQCDKHDTLLRGIENLLRRCLRHGLLRTEAEVMIGEIEAALSTPSHVAEKPWACYRLGGAPLREPCGRCDCEHAPSAASTTPQKLFFWTPEGMQPDDGENMTTKYVEASAPSAIAMFTPTHRHADGGLYRLVTGSRYKTAREDEWSDCIIYEAQDRKLYVTTPARWTDRFTALEAQ